MKEAVREGSDNSDMMGPGRKEVGGRVKSKRDNQKTFTNNIKYAHTVSHGLLALCSEAPVISPLLHRSSASCTAPASMPAAKHTQLHTEHARAALPGSTPAAWWEVGHEQRRRNGKGGGDGGAEARRSARWSVSHSKR